MSKLLILIPLLTGCTTPCSCSKEFNILRMRISQLESQMTLLEFSPRDL